MTKNHDYCYAEMPNEDYKILKYNHWEKSMKVPYLSWLSSLYLKE